MKEESITEIAERLAKAHESLLASMKQAENAGTWTLASNGG